MTEVSAPHAFYSAPPPAPPTVKRPAGVTASAVVLFLLAGLKLIGALFMVLATVLVGSQMHSPAMQQALADKGMGTRSMGMSIVVYMVLTLLFIALAAWCITVGVGLIRLKSWARLNAQIIGGFCLMFGGIYFLMMLLVMLNVGHMPLPQNGSSADPHMTRVIMVIMFAFMLFIGGVLALLGGWWVWYFGSSAVRSVFSAHGAAAKPGRPFFVSFLTILYLAGSVFLLAMICVPHPAAFLGFVLHGWAKDLYYLVHAAVEVACVIGLWRLRKWGYWLTLGILIWGTVMIAILLVDPGLNNQYRREMRQIYRTTNHYNPLETNPIQRAIFSFSLLIDGGFIVGLVLCRKAFDTPSLPQPDIFSIPPPGPQTHEGAENLSTPPEPDA